MGIHYCLCHSVFNGCPYGPDSRWNITWANTPRNTVDTQRCPGGVETRGNYVEVINNVEYYKTWRQFFPLWILPPYSVDEGNGCHIVWGELPGCVCWWQRSWGPVNYHDIVFAGNATRLCMGDGNWTEPNVLECESLQFLRIRLEVFCLCCSIVVAYQMFQACCYLEVLLFSS